MTQSRQEFYWLLPGQPERQCKPSPAGIEESGSGSQLYFMPSVPVDRILSGWVGPVLGSKSFSDLLCQNLWCGDTWEATEDKPTSRHHLSHAVDSRVCRIKFPSLSRGIFISSLIETEIWPCSLIKPRARKQSTPLLCRDRTFSRAFL